MLVGLHSARALTRIPASVVAALSRLAIPLGVDRPRADRLGRRGTGSILARSPASPWYPLWRVRPCPRPATISIPALAWRPRACTQSLRRPSGAHDDRPSLLPTPLRISVLRPPVISRAFSRWPAALAPHLRPSLDIHRDRHQTHAVGPCQRWHRLVTGRATTRNPCLLLALVTSFPQTGCRPSHGPSATGNPLIPGFLSPRAIHLSPSWRGTRPREVTDPEISHPHHTQ